LGNQGVYRTRNKGKGRNSQQGKRSEKKFRKSLGKKVDSIITGGTVEQAKEMDDNEEYATKKEEEKRRCLSASLGREKKPFT